MAEVYRYGLAATFDSMNGRLLSGFWLAERNTCHLLYLALLLRLLLENFVETYLFKLRVILSIARVTECVHILRTGIGRWLPCYNG